MAALTLVGLMLGGCASSAERQADAAKRQRLIETNLQMAANYLQRDQLDFAKEKLDKALAIDADDSQANNMMALLQWRVKDYSAAERHFVKAVAGQNQNAEAQNNFGAFLCERGRIDEAEQWFKKAIANPFYHTPADANQNAGLCLMKKPAPQAAEVYFREALKVNPRLAISLHQMAKISFDAGKTLAARGFIQRYFQAAGDTPEALLLAIRIERKLGNKNDEASYALRLRGKYPDSPEARALKTGELGRGG